MKLNNRFVPGPIPGSNSPLMCSVCGRLETACECMTKLKTVEEVATKYFHDCRVVDLEELLAQDRHSIHTNLVEAVERKKAERFKWDYKEGDGEYKDGYNEALQDTLTIINSIFKE